VASVHDVQRPPELRQVAINTQKAHDSHLGIECHVEVEGVPHELLAEPGNEGPGSHVLITGVEVAVEEFGTKNDEQDGVGHEGVDRQCLV